MVKKYQKNDLSVNLIHIGYISCFSAYSEDKKEGYIIPKHEFYFVRHGQTYWGKEDLLKGPQDLSLNPTGIDQAHKAASIIKKISNTFSKAVIIVSTLKRALETGVRISKITNIPIVDRKYDLREHYYGDHRLIPKDSIAKLYEEMKQTIAHDSVFPSFKKIFTWNQYKTLLSCPKIGWCDMKSS